MTMMGQEDSHSIGMVYNLPEAELHDLRERDELIAL